MLQIKLGHKIFLILFLLFLVPNAYASISMEAPNCPFMGKVGKLELREEDGEGISKGFAHRYIDITVFILDGTITGPNQRMLGCDIPDNSVQVFQMHATKFKLHHPALPDVGECIKGYSHFSADGNFVSGNWLTIEEILEKEECP